MTSTRHINYNYHHHNINTVVHIVYVQYILRTCIIICIVINVMQHACLLCACTVQCHGAGYYWYYSWPIIIIFPGFQHCTIILHTLLSQEAWGRELTINYYLNTIILNNCIHKKTCYFSQKQ